MEIFNYIFNVDASRNIQVWAKTMKWKIFGSTNLTVKTLVY